ncbi:hypothetical protein Dxin01_02685 [Deinococcus xinjiangensis]|uniref:Uncharacterized protein n=1 Tax=Deinococcus xinjiangensis TaxID=457454 RepID=A0ABP9VFV3_9DEIO
MFTRRLIANIGQLMLLASSERHTVATGALVRNGDDTARPVKVFSDGIIEFLGPTPVALPKGERFLDYTVRTELLNSVCL